MIPRLRSPISTLIVAHSHPDRRATGSLYVPGERSDDWQKLKLENQQEFVIGGYRPAGSNAVDALLVGHYMKTACGSPAR
jgi:ATP-dependent DNA ligase